jgi:hypothetical protein
MVSCSSKKDFTTKEYSDVNKKSGKTTDWDYGKVRDVRAAEKEQEENLPASASIPTESKSSKATTDSGCHPVSKSQVERAKLESCVKLDPKEGFGDDMFCCPGL